jgi:DNA-binding transcriptional MocR family regulator
MPAEPFYPTRTGPPALRLSFGHIDAATAREGARRMGAALRDPVEARELNGVVREQDE